MARVHVYLVPDDYDDYKSGKEVSAIILNNNSCLELIHMDVDDREVTELAWPLVTIKKVV